ncbi:hypothetical protein KOW79_017017 [Hemibagrus wyckioides]|uniref:Uncharacterized protein n=1 Tax=Hemibagrus wyckioides TaxID=337641 RepID=A0A9D3NE83_9TELE|nr:hypothetical protein KOW79_017017 [Hemibagrus wyckioides]
MRSSCRVSSLLSCSRLLDDGDNHLDVHRPSRLDAYAHFEVNHGKLFPFRCDQVRLELYSHREMMTMQAEVRWSL